MLKELVADTAIDLLRAQQSVWELALAKFRSTHKAFPVHASRTMDGELPTIDHDYATWLDDQRAAVLLEIRKIERRRA